MAIIEKFLKGPASAALVQVGSYLSSVENLLDFSVQNFDDVLEADEVLSIIIPVNAVIKSVSYQVLSEQAATTVAINDTDGNVYVAAADVSATTDIITTTNVTEVVNMVTGGHIEIVPAGADLTELVIWVQVEYYVREQG